jgi:hypothetical protein
MQKFKRRLKEEPLIPLGMYIPFLFFSHIRKISTNNVVI